MRSPRKNASLVSLLAALALLAAGCGSDDEPGSAEVTSGDAPAVESTTTDAADSTAPESLGDVADQIGDAVPADQRGELLQQCLDRVDSEAAAEACEAALGE